MLLSSVVKKMMKPCWKPSVLEGDSNGHVDGLFWYKDIAQFSMAVIQANRVLEDQCQIESGPLNDLDHGPNGTFVGVYDGHGGPEAARFVNDHLFSNVKKYASEHREISSAVIKKAFSTTEEDFLSIVRQKWLSKPHYASVGSCCLAGIISDGTMYIANAGDSRVVLGRSKRGLKDVSAIQLSTEHNASYESVRDELRVKHPNDAQIVVQRHKVWRVRGIIQVSRSIGDAYLKKAEFNREPLLSKFILPKPFFNPILSWEPSISVHKLRPEDRFLVFASDGLWEHLSNQEVVNIVNYNPHTGIARRLVKAALVEAAKKREMRYSDLQKIEPGVRRHFHDDITVVVVFLGPSSLPLSVKGGGGVAIAADL